MGSSHAWSRTRISWEVSSRMNLLVNLRASFKSSIREAIHLIIWFPSGNARFCNIFARTVGLVTTCCGQCGALVLTASIHTIMFGSYAHTDIQSLARCVGPCFLDRITPKYLRLLYSTLTRKPPGRGEILRWQLDLSSASTA